MVQLFITGDTLAAIMATRILATALYAHSTLLEVWLSTNGIEGSQRNEIGIVFGKMEWHEHLSRCNDASDTKLNSLDTSAS